MISKKITWSEEKNKLLKDKRGISFEQIAQKILKGDFLDIIDHPNREKYAHQKIIVVEIDNYAYDIPFVINENEIFLKTIYANRKHTKIYLNKEKL